MPNCFPVSKSTLAQDVTLKDSPGSVDNPKRILVVMDGLKEFSVNLLEWVLKNFTLGDCSSVTVLGITPWLNIPLSAKTSDIWAMDFDDLSAFQEKNELKSDARYQKVQHVIDLCKDYGVVPEIRTEMGHPIRLLVVEQISSLQATLVVFDRHHDKKYIEYYAEKIPCSMVSVNGNGKVDLIKKRKCNDSSWAESTPVAVEEESPVTAPPCSKFEEISQHLKKYLKPKAQGKQDTDFN